MNLINFFINKINFRHLVLEVIKLWISFKKNLNKK